MTNAKRHSWQDYTGNCLNLGCDAQEFAGADEPCPWKPPIAVNPQVPSNDRVSDFYLESTLRSISEARALDSQMISTSFLRMLCNELIERRAALGIDWQQIARERTVDIALADQRIERLQRELADVSHTKNALQGMLDAAEQHVRILQEQRASLEPGTGLLARMREINRLALNVENDPWANLTRIAELTCIESPAHVRRVVGHASGWQEQMDTCVCGEPWPCARASQPPSGVRINPIDSPGLGILDRSIPAYENNSLGRVRDQRPLVPVSDDHRVGAESATLGGGRVAHQDVPAVDEAGVLGIFHEASVTPSVLTRIASIVHDTSYAAEDRVRHVQELVAGSAQPPCCAVTPGELVILSKQLELCSDAFERRDCHSMAEACRKSGEILAAIAGCSTSTKCAAPPCVFRSGCVNGQACVDAGHCTHGAETLSRMDSATPGEGSGHE